MWVGPPSPAQPDSLGFGDQSSSGKEALMSIYVGMDVHRKRSQVAIVDAAGVPQRNRNLANDPAKLVPVLGALPPGTPVAFEAAYGWGWLVELLEELELEPHLVHPSRCKAIASARLKNDKVERPPWPSCCGLICCPRPGSHPGRSGICGPGCATGPPWSGLSTACKNRVHAVLADRGVREDQSLWTGAGRAWLAGLGLPPTHGRSSRTAVGCWMPWPPRSCGWSARSPDWPSPIPGSRRFRPSPVSAS